ncbi:MAG: RtcB family protein [Nanoarchaeota archaeon]
MDTERPVGPPKEIKKINDFTWELPTSYKKGMNVPARIIASEKLLKQMDFGVFDQVSNVACLKGIQKQAFCMPDGHWGYGFPIGGVAAMDTSDGVISPGGIGFDINCGMRLVRTNLTLTDAKSKLKELNDELFKTVPAGVGCKGIVKLNKTQFKTICNEGSKWCVENGYGNKNDIKKTESHGRIEQADPSKISDKVIKRGLAQLGTLGSGNHYLEVQVAHKDAIYNQKIAKTFGITKPEQIVIMCHCGSRGTGHQVATDYLKMFDNVMNKYKLTVNDRELSCAPFSSSEGQDYFKAMACAANMAFANRQVIMHRIREAFMKIFDMSESDLGLELIYDVAHNIAKVETHKIDGSMKEVIVHRKGATRAFGPGEKELPAEYQEAGQPIILGGSMETGSFLLAGTQTAMDETFGSTAHGSGRTMSRTKAKHEVNGEELQKNMEKRGIYVRTKSMAGLAEEAGIAYKPISDVVDSLEGAGISKKVAGLTPLTNVKG